MRACIIPARGGSKRIPQKNIKRFHGKPIIEYSIETALRSSLFDLIVVSTDCPNIAKVAEKAGASVPFVRPPEYSNDYATTVQVVRHAIQVLQSKGHTFTSVCCLYPTAPFVTPGTLKRGLELLEQGTSSFSIPVVEFPYPIQRALKMNPEGKIEMIGSENVNVRSQDLSRSFHDAGQYYWGSSDAWLVCDSIFSESCSALPLEAFMVRDIDTPDDWVFAELLYESLLKRKLL